MKVKSFPVSKIVARIISISALFSTALAMAGSGDTQDHPCSGLDSTNEIKLTEKTGPFGGAGSCQIALSDDVLNAIQSITNIQNDLNTAKNDINSIKNQSGNKLSASQEGAVMYDNPNMKDKVTLNPGGSGTTITNVKDGQLAVGSKDAVNGGQLNKVAGSAAEHLGGGAVFDPTTGTIKAPKYVINGNNYNNVGDALGALDSTTSKLIKGELGLIQTDGTTTTIDKDGTSTTINVAGVNGDRIISGVADGINRNDAVNKGQLEDKFASVNSQINTIRTETKQEIAHMNNQIKNLDERIDRNRKSASQGIASAMAMSIEYPSQHPGEFATGVGMGTYDGETSLAIGMNYLTPNGKFKFYGGIGQALGSNSKTAGKIGIGFVW